MITMIGVCSECGQEIDAWISDDLIKVEPCEKCLKEESEAQYWEGYHDCQEEIGIY